MYCLHVCYIKLYYYTLIVFSSALPYTASYCIVHFFLSLDALYLIDVESVRERCTESHELSLYMWLRFCTWTEDVFKGYLRLRGFCARAAERGEKESYTRWAAGREKSHIREYTKSSEGRGETDACTPGPSVPLRATRSRFHRGPDTNHGAEPGPTRSTVVVLYLICDH